MVALAFCEMVQGQLVRNKMQDTTLAGAEVLREDHVIFGRIASEHKQTIIKCQSLSVVQVQLGQGRYVKRKNIYEMDMVRGRRRGVVV